MYRRSTPRQRIVLDIPRVQRPIGAPPAPIQPSTPQPASPSRLQRPGRSGRSIGKNEKQRRLDLFRVIYEGFGFDMPTVEPGMLYTDVAGMKRKIPSNARGFEILEKRLYNISRKMDADIVLSSLDNHISRVTLIQRIARGRLTRRVSSARRLELLTKLSIENVFNMRIFRIHVAFGAVLKRVIAYNAGAPGSDVEDPRTDIVQSIYEAAFRKVWPLIESMHGGRIRLLTAATEMVSARDEEDLQAIFGRVSDASAEVLARASLDSLTRNRLASEYIQRTRSDFANYIERCWKKTNEDFILSEEKYSDSTWLTTAQIEIKVIPDDSLNQRFRRTAFDAPVPTPSLILDSDDSDSDDSDYGGCYQEIDSSIRGVISPQNTDQRCFAYATAAYFANLEKKRNLFRPSVLNKYLDRFVLPETFPVKVSDIDEIERRNPTLCWSVYHLDEDLNAKDLRIVKPSVWRSREHHITLVLHKNHYMLCTSLDNFITSRVEGSDKLRGVHCPLCLRRFPKASDGHSHYDKMLEHAAKCRGMDRPQVNTTERAELEQAVASTPYERLQSAIAELEKCHDKTERYVLEKRIHALECRQAMKYIETNEKVPFRIYADFEMINAPHGNEGTIVFDQLARSFAYSVACDDDIELDDCLRKRLYVGPDASSEFILSLLDLLPKLENALHKYRHTLPELDETQQAEFDNATNCYVCSEPFGNDKKNRKVLDHCHRTGKYRGAACPTCNLKMRDSFKNIPVFFHNMNYDIQAVVSALADPRVQASLDCKPVIRPTGDSQIEHRICEILHSRDPSQLTKRNIREELEREFGAVDRALVRKYVDDFVDLQRSVDEVESKKRKKIQVTSISINGEKFKTFTFSKFRMLDSMGFMNASLDELIKLLSPTQKPQLDAVADKFATEKGLDTAHVRRVLGGKIAFAYENDWFAKRNEPILETDVFGSRLNSIGKMWRRSDNKTLVGEKDHDSLARENADAVFSIANALHIETWGELHDLYLQLDVAGLHDTMEYFSKRAKDIYKIEAFTSLGTPMLAQRAALKSSGVEIGLIQTKEQYQWFESAKHGGLSMARRALCEANHPGLENYDPSKPLVFIHYDDVNNLYGKAMLCMLPSGVPYEVPTDTFDITDEDKWGRAPAYFNEPCEFWQTENGGVIEADWEYPTELHDGHSDYPLAPDRIEVPDAWLNPEQRASKRLMLKKLVAHLGPRRNYKCTITMALVLLKFGLKLVRVHRVMAYEQSFFMRDFVQGNSDRRAIAKAAKNDFDIDFFKLMNNSAYGKFGEQVWDRTQTSYIHSESRFNKLVTSGRCLNVQRITDDFACVFCVPERIDLCKPVHVMVAILDLSKIHMAMLWYTEIRAKFPTAQLLMTDTDSFAYAITPTTVKEYEAKMAKLNGRVFDDGSMVGLVKSEVDKGNAIESFVAVKAKCYSYKLAKPDKKGRININKLKGTTKRLVARIAHETFVEVMRDRIETVAEIARIGYKNHNIHMFKQTRKALSHHDDKGYFVDLSTTLAHGHYKSPSFGLIHAGA